MQSKRILILPNLVWHRKGHWGLIPNRFSWEPKKILMYYMHGIRDVWNKEKLHVNWTLGLSAVYISRSSLYFLSTTNIPRIFRMNLTCEVLFSYSRWEFCKLLSMFQEDVKLHKKVESRNERNTTKLGHQPHHVTGGQGHQESGQGHSDERRETARTSGRKWWGYAVVVRGWYCFIFHLNRPQQMYKCSLMWNSNVH